MKANKMRELTNQELNDRERELKTELFNLRFQLATGQLDNTQRISQCKKDIARVKTLIREREIRAVAK